MADAIKSQGTYVKIGDQGDSPGVLTEISEVVSLNGFDGQAAEIDVTHMQSTAKEFLQGLQDFGQIQMDVNYLPSDAGQVEARAAKASQTIKQFEITFSDTSTATFLGFVLSNPISMGVDSKVDSSFVIRISGDVTFA